MAHNMTSLPTLEEIAEMGRNCSTDQFFDAIIKLKLVHNHSLVQELYKCPLGESSEPKIAWSELGPPLIVYSLTFLLGVIGNTLIVVAVGGYRKMKSSTNIFLASLAVADLLFCLICIPVKLAKLFSFSWNLGFFMCKFVNYLENVLAVSSALNLTAMSLERCYAIRYPLKARSVCTNSRAKKSVVLVWLLATILATPMLYVQAYRKVGIIQTAYWCQRDSEKTLWWRMHEIYMFGLILAFPSIIMSVAYGLIAKEMCKCVKQREALSAHLNSGENNRPTSPFLVESSRVPKSLSTDAVISCAPEPARPSNEDSTLSKLTKEVNELVEEETLKHTHLQVQRRSSAIVMAERVNRAQQADSREKTLQIVRMLAAIVVVFVVCWTPLLIINILQSFGAIDLQIHGWPKHAKTVSSLMAYLNSALNPIIYGFMSRNFRDSFKRAMSKICLPLFGRRYFLAGTGGMEVSVMHTQGTQAAQIHCRKPLAKECFSQDQITRAFSSCQGPGQTIASCTSAISFDEDDK